MAILYRHRTQLSHLLCHNLILDRVVGRLSDDHGFSFGA